MYQDFLMIRLRAILLIIVASSVVQAQSVNRASVTDTPALVAFAWPDGTLNFAAPAPPPDMAANVPLPRMSPELALTAFQQRAERQAQSLAGYSAATMIRAELPDSAQRGEYELERHFVAPHSLTFKTVHYTGDSFVKTNVIARLLQSEVEHVQKGDPGATALRFENYKFSYKGTTQVGGRILHVYQVKPRKKRVGLFKGHVYLDALSGSLVRAEGRVVKSPSLFVKKIDFVQEYEDVNGFTLPVHMHSEAKATLVGRTVVDVVNRDYQPLPGRVESAAVSGSR
jgi:hypothetical protein